MLNFDARTLPSDLNTPSPARFTLSAHDGAVSSLDVNPHIKGCLVTGGTDKLVKVWNVVDDADGGKRNVSLVTSRDLGVVSGFFFSLSLAKLNLIMIAGQSLLNGVFTGRPPYACCSWVEGEVADLGCWC